MSRFPDPTIFIAACSNRHRLARQVKFLREENRILRARHPARISTTPEERGSRRGTRHTPRRPATSARDPRSSERSCYGQCGVGLYHLERNHQGLGNRLIAGPAPPENPVGPIRCRTRLGGVLKSYERVAA